MIELDEHEGSYLAICKHYKAVYETAEIRENPEKLKEVCHSCNLCRDNFHNLHTKHNSKL